MNYTEILVYIRKIIRSVNLDSKRIEKEYGISIPQMLCLNFLKEQKEHRAAQKDIKDFLQLNASTVTGIIKRLEKKALVARLPKQEDRRVGLITITAQGAELLESAPEPMHELLKIKLQKLPPDKIDELGRAFRLIIDFLDIKSVEASPIVTGGANIDE
jgi:DNA-binding MarR family transcriptional regulator